MMKSKIIIIISIFMNLLILVSATLPDYFDWRNKDGENWMTSVKNQEHCGSCWAFTAVGVVEAQYNIAKDNSSYDLNLSEEHLVSNCSIAGDCDGGWHHSALGYIRDNGIVNETCFPYIDANCYDNVCGCTYGCSNAKCSDNLCIALDNLYYIDDYESISNNITEIKTYLYKTGPIAAVMRWGGSYWDGDISRCNVDTPIDHAIIITGYNETGDYWIVKNSWGESWWVDGGYFKVGYGECGIQTSAYGVNLTLCTCTSWTAGECGTGGCLSSEKPYTRTCNPSGCDEESKCEFDSDCLPPAGSDITVCASGCNYTSIQTAIDNSDTNDKVYVKDNRSYEENILMNSTTTEYLVCENGSRIYGTSNEGITLEDVSSPVIFGCIIDGFTYGIYIKGNTDNGLIENNTIINNGIGIHFRYNIPGMKIKNNNISNSGTYGIEFDGATWSNSAISNQIEDNILEDNGENVYMKFGQTNSIGDNSISEGSYGIHVDGNGNKIVGVGGIIGCL